MTLVSQELIGQVRRERERKREREHRKRRGIKVTEHFIYAEGQIE